MNRIISYSIVVLLAFSIANAKADIIWQNDYDQFRYGINKNGGIFYYYVPPVTHYSSRQGTEAFAYNPFQGQFDPFDSVAYVEFVEFGRSDIPGQITLKALAEGPDGGQNPKDGLTVQASAEIIPEGLNGDHGVQLEQDVTSFITREFIVDKDATYTVQSDLAGVVDFDTFNNSDFYKGTYTLSAEVDLEEIVNVGGEDEIRKVSGFPLVLNEATRTRTAKASLSVKNSQQLDIVYRLKVVIRIQSVLRNIIEPGTIVAGPISGTYNIGDENSPLRLTATLSQGAGMPGIPLLLLNGN